MTLREEVVKYSGEELLSEEVLEEMADWVVPLVQGMQGVAEWMKTAVQSNPGAAGASFLVTNGLLLGGFVNALLYKRKQGIRALRYAKIKEADKEQIEKTVNSDMSDAAKKSLIYRILGKYATKVENTVNKVKDAVGKTRIGINHKLAKEARKEQKNTIEYKKDENAFKRCSKEEIKLILRICRITPNSGIENLTLKDIDQKLPRGRDDNFLVRAQGLMNLITSGVSPDVAYASTGIFPDSNEAYQKSLDFYGGIENWIKYFVFKQVDEPEGEETEEDNEETDDNTSEKIKGTKEWSINRANEKLERQFERKN